MKIVKIVIEYFILFRFFIYMRRARTVYILIGPRIAVAQQPGPDIRLIDISLAEHPFFFRRLAETMPAHGPVFFFLGIGGV
jgi:hypothetical protein